jgi:hypothetical protein
MEKLTSYQTKYTNSWALVIGINAYEHVSHLGYATNDAKGLAEVLETRFFFPKENIILLLDEKATADKIREAFLAFADEEKIKPDDRLLVFFAGHGHTVLGRRGEVGYLVPTDGLIDNLATLIRWDELTRNADLIPAKHVFFMMDACYGGLAHTRTPALGSMRFLGNMLERFGRQVLTAGKADEVVSDGDGTRVGHSIFTSHLLDALEGAASTQDGVLTANGVMAYVYQRVSQDQYSKQTPHYGFVDGEGDFIFDLSLLEALQKAGQTASSGPLGDQAGIVGEEDILTNTSQELVVLPDLGSPISRTVKALLSDPTKKIVLDDFVTRHVKKFLAATDLRNFPVQDSAVQKDDFIDRLHRYEAATADLQEIVILLARWGDQNQLFLLEKIFIRLAEADKGSAGVVMWLHLTWYPLQNLMYVAGIAALSAGNYSALKVVFQTMVQTNHDGKKLPLVVAVGANMTDIVEQFKLIPGQEQKYVPRSEYLHKLLQPGLEDMLLLGKSYESLFDAFEILFALTFASYKGRGWGPIGRFGWKHSGRHGESPFDALLDEANGEKEKWGPLQAGLFGGSSETFTDIAKTFKAYLDRLSWW